MGAVCRLFWGVVVGEESVFGVRFALQTTHCTGFQISDVASSIVVRTPPFVTGDK